MSNTTNPPAAPQRAMTPRKVPLRWIVAAVVAAVLVLGFAAFLVVKPDREACKAAIGAEVDTMLANDKPIEQWEEPNADELRARVSWPCRFQSDAQLEAIGREVFSERFPEIMTRAFTEAFSGLGVDTPSAEPT
jgi:hypothetical protein